MRILSLLPLLLLTFYCGNSLPFQDEIVLARPTGITITAVSPLKFDLSYFVQNQEDTFTGYNIYIARSTIGESETVSTNTVIPPLILDGSVPTFKHSKAEVNVNTPVTKTLSVYNDAVTAFENGVTYFFRITAYSRTKIESRPSNEVSATAIP